MNKEINLKEAINKIFDCDYDAEDYNPEGEMYDFAQKILEEYPWEEIFQCAVIYFKGHSSNLDQVLNFINLYVSNNFIDRQIPKPYEFAALIASKVDFEADWDKGADRIDNFLVFMLDKMGTVSLYVDPYYQLEDDPQFLAALSEIKKNNTNKQ